MDIGTDEVPERARDAAAVFPDRTGTCRDESRPAVFLDRDGTLIEHVPYLSDPALVRLLPGAAESLEAAPSRGVRLRAGDEPVGDRPGHAHRRPTRSDP